MGNQEKKQWENKVLMKKRIIQFDKELTVTSTFSQEGVKKTQGENRKKKIVPAYQETNLNWKFWTHYIDEYEPLRIRIYTAKRKRALH